MLLKIFLLICLVKTLECCVCWTPHIQEQFCKADFVIIATIDDIDLLPKGEIFSVRDVKVLKLTQAGRIAVDKKKIYTLTASAMCGVVGFKDKRYLMIGQVLKPQMEAWVDVCKTFIEWKDVSLFQKIAIQSRIYGKNCKCKISEDPITSNNVCQIEKTAKSKDCLYKFGLCLRDINGKCNWIQNPQLDTCLNS